jgi:hypothetical protein
MHALAQQAAVEISFNSACFPARGTPNKVINNRTDQSPSKISDELGQTRQERGETAP